ncbi:MAG: AAA family ATPase [Patescibacteria group bacterium]
MIKKIVIENFKKFEKAEMEFGLEPVLFVGQNNGGKTTALQAISLWSFLIKRWQMEKAGSTATERTGLPISRNTVSAAPVHDIKMLWHDGNVQDKKSKKIKIIITAHGRNNGEDWDYGIEATFANKELLYCKPLDIKKSVPTEAINVFHLPPLSGGQTSEKKLDEAAQQQAVGEGRPGEILRNLLLRVQSEHNEEWQRLKEKAAELFQVQLQDISYSPAIDPSIIIEYAAISPDESKTRMQFEIASAGSGFLQYLLLAAFMYAHESGAVLLLDEPDSHMHTFLQRNTYHWLQETAAHTNSQLIISTHSEVLVDSTNDISQITTFFGKSPKKLVYDKRLLASVLKDVSTLDIINAEWQGKIFFAEGDTDLRIIRAFSDVLRHPVLSKLNNPSFFFRPFNTNDIDKASNYFNALKKIVSPELKGFCLRDFIEPTGRTQNVPFQIEYWDRLEIENYLINRESLLRFLEKKGIMGLFLQPARDFLNQKLPKAVLDDPIKEDIGRKGSDFLNDFFNAITFSINKGSYWEIAAGMKKTEINPSVVAMLDKLNDFLS